jgi:hypothetical protein
VLALGGLRVWRWHVNNPQHRVSLPRRSCGSYRPAWSGQRWRRRGGHGRTAAASPTASGRTTTGGRPAAPRAAPSLTRRGRSHVNPRCARPLVPWLVPGRAAAPARRAVDGQRGGWSSPTPRPGRRRGPSGGFVANALTAGSRRRRTGSSASSSRRRCRRWCC